MPHKIVVLLKGYPRLSETFIAQELLGLERAGLDLVLVSLRRPTDKKRHPVHDEIKAPVSYLPEYLHEEPLRVLRGLFRSLRAPGFGAAIRQFLKDLPRDFSRNRFRRFGQAAVLVGEFPEAGGWLHAHFIHTPASVANYAARMLALPFSVSAHAKDIWTSKDWELADKLSTADWAVTCTKSGHAHLQALAGPNRDRVHLSYHGLDLDRFPPLEDGAYPPLACRPSPPQGRRSDGETSRPSPTLPIEQGFHSQPISPPEGEMAGRPEGGDARHAPHPEACDCAGAANPRPPRDGSDPENPVTVISVGRAVPKKGYDILLEALARLPGDLHWRFVHAGDGGERVKLQKLADELGIAQKITWLGAVDQKDVLAAYRRADIFALACRITPDGDRDGLPNVLVEAASQQLACVATDISGIPELFETEENGLLVPSEDAAAFSRALERAIRDPALRHRLGAAAEAKVRGSFDHHTSIAQLKALFTTGARR
ncbi:glycosyltransferase [Shinella sp.]|uniref:glycosyltransferase n=1 Tax=Shinella sp. TaxID=1870904 RepID=UPI002584C018|nr:glycosyltransferase [Shinella sp.]